MKPRLGLLFWMITLVLSVQAYSAEKQGVLRSKANGYSIGIPESWKQVPEGLAGDILKDVFIAESMTVHDCEAVLGFNSEDGQFEFPCLVVK